MSLRMLPRPAAPRSTRLRPLTAALSLFFGTLVMAQSAPLEDLASFPRTTLDIVSGKQKHHFEVWVANTPQREEQGLMFVRQLPPEQGMIFPQGKPRPMSMWMKNTFVELDMVFITDVADAGMVGCKATAPASLAGCPVDGRISKIVEHAVPQSLATIDSGGAISAVLEIAGGEASKQGLHVGDRVSWKQ